MQQQLEQQQQRRQHQLPAAAAGEGGPAGAEPPPKPKQQFKFCRMCGGALELVLPDGNWRHVCTQCQYVDYQNPRMVVGTIVQHEGRILLCRRGIEPQRGLWTVPAGYLECGESSAAGAARETLEEAGAQVHIDAPYVMFDIPQISQIYLLFRARLAPPFTFAAREPESLEAALFRPEDIPWDSLAFSSVSIALKHYVQDLERGSFSVHQGVIQKQPGSGPNEPGSFQLVDHVQLDTPAPAPSR
ncbi:nudix hydrolase chloroplastic-like [Chlorella sorokiniana]|uniref:Nudix hydrolase chloroplastic-like n=1 Tax=Chlorella sorokiniana TaxID=3076 RepID=A0A2P6TVU8_CHLSO|nr:nudix hydrolase chloroplastic-like [Chlorella sorokiniana]|eukprot:PRW58187.1 nudix hydrolase chloroplastic-like [Chlorella sorokiniana]